MALTKPIWIRPNLVSKKREPYREGEKRGRERKKKRKRKRRRRRERSQDQRYGTMTFSMDLWNFKTLYG